MAKVIGLHTVEFEQEEESGHRTFTAKYKVAHDIDEGPLAIESADGLPAIGDHWEPDELDEIDEYARRTPYAKCTYMVEGERANYSIVEIHFTTKPIKRCQDTQIENPLLEPPKISGSFIEQTMKAVYDIALNPVMNSAGERMDVEIEASSLTVDISVNVDESPISLIATMLHKLNDAELWGLPAKCIKLSTASWETLYWGVCTKYYKLNMGFKIRAPYSIDSGIPIRRKKNPGDPTSTEYEWVVEPGNVTTTVGGWVYAAYDRSAGRVRQPGANASSQMNTILQRDQMGDTVDGFLLDGKGKQAVRDPNTGLYNSAIVIFEFYKTANLLELPIPDEL